MPFCIGGTSSSAAGNGQFGLLSRSVMRVSACTPMVSVMFCASICGCAAAARIGFISSHSRGRPVSPPPSAIERHSFAHCSRAARSSIGSLRRRVSSLAICALTSRSIRGLASPATSILNPASTTVLSASVTCEVRFGSSRQSAAIAGRACTVTLPWMSARWSSTWLAILPTLLPIDLSISPAIEPVMLPACSAIWPVMRSVPVSGVAMVISFGLPAMLKVRRSSVMPMSALDSRLLTALSFLPANWRGAASSSLRWMARSATATGAIT